MVKPLVICSRNVLVAHGVASEEGFNAFIKSKKIKAKADTHNRKIGLQICNQHNLLVYESNDDSYFHRIS